MRVEVRIMRRPEIADPEAVTVVRALAELGFTEVTAARFNRSIVLEVGGLDPDFVRARVEDMCRKLLANPVIEDFEVEVIEQ